MLCGYSPCFIFWNLLLDRFGRHPYHPQSSKRPRILTSGVRFEKLAEKENTPKNDPVLVIGGGIAGMQTSLDLADIGCKVYLVEKNPAIGGRMAQLDKTFPTNDCAI
jgi:heterodisulfide reductase subunit A